MKNMKKIIENPNPKPIMIVVCPDCDCKFEFTDVDVERALKGEYEWGYKTSCPNCGKTIWLKNYRRL